MAERAMNRIICGDALTEMEKLGDKSFDFVITDPPYGIGADVMLRKRHLSQPGHFKNYGITQWDSAPPDFPVFDEIFRVGKDQIIFGGNYFTYSLPPSPCWIVWDKGHEKSALDFAEAELIYTSSKKAVRIFRHQWMGFLQEDMINKDYRVHPTQKPLVLMKRLIATFTKEGDTILDPFAGSGTTLVAAKQMNRQYLGIEINPDYCAIAEQRLLQEQLI